MKQLHSYWRIKYVETPKEERPKDIFSRIPEEKDESKSLLLFRSSKCYVVLNRFPYNTGHTLVIPYRAVPDLLDLNLEERFDLMETIIRTENILKLVLEPDAFNIGFNIGESAGAGIPQHLHAHIVPRWEGDTNFMPVLANTRVLPEALGHLWKRIRDYIDGRMQP
jgi:ATP adenylyltransferase